MLRFEKELNKTQFTQPALYVVNAFTYYKKIEESGLKPDYIVGHSLGEFNALLAAECFSFEAGLKLVKKRGELMAETTDGGMAAILNASKTEIESILATNGLTNIDLANYNTPSQIVISGLIEEIGEAQKFFQQGEMLYYPLNTSGAFHSRFMEASKEKFQRYINKFKLSDSSIPVISNVTAMPYQNNEVLTNLPKQMTSTVQWCDTIEYLLGIEKAMEFEEIGNGDVLTKLIKTIKEHNQVFDLDEQKDEVKVEKKKEAKNSVAELSDDSPKAFIQAEKKVSDWNKNYQIGTKVKSLHVDYDELETRTEAVVLFGHRAAVYMKNHNGYFDLNEITPQ